MKRVYIKTFGCQMNVYDSGKMRALLARDGYEYTDDPEQADLVIVNTCSIREKPEHKLHSLLGELRPMKSERPLTLAIAGCVAQQDGQKLFRKYGDVDLVFGPDGVPRIRELVAEAQARRVLDTQFLEPQAYPFATDLDPSASDSVGAFVTIQKGCDNKCTFCIVPSTRGIEVSRPSRQVLEEVAGLVGQGVREITLIGQNVNSYGLKMPQELNFAELVRAVAQVPGVERLRYTTSHPRDMGQDVIQAYRDLPNLTSHLHLPVQSGSTRVLRRMKRFYTRERYIDVVASLRAARPDIVFTTDFIVGFPGESDEDFEETLSLLREVRFQGSFSFKYSPRPGTPALRLLDDAVPDSVASERLSRLQALQHEISLAANRELEGQVVEVLVEGPSRYDDAVVCGRTSTFKMVNFPGSWDLVGQTVPVTVLRGATHSLRGEQIVAAGSA
ncbi:MAG: tRNA (N6-isopentenyl adenosine(37)-C2)-methylthiotransferase MiaB [Myxococcota bacterium]|nr:tRNA (N6-isopentenyl adenosine(37)-C2)-methylthiotransferase MiaB [Myxococcota bacterium]